MTWFNRRAIARKLTLDVAAVLALMIVLAVFCCLQWQQLYGVSAAVTGRWSPAVRGMLTIKAALQRVRTYELQHARSATAKDYAYYEQQMTQKMSDMDIASSACATLPRGAAAQVVFDEFTLAVADYRAAVAKVIALDRAGDHAAATALIRSESRRHHLRATNLIDQLLSASLHGGVHAAAGASRLNMAAGLILAAVALGMLLASLFRLQRLSEASAEGEEKNVARVVAAVMAVASMATRERVLLKLARASAACNARQQGRGGVANLV